MQSSSVTMLAWQLEAEGYSTIIQAWDFRPGGNFVLQMDEATKRTKRTIAVLSPSYLTSLFTQPEWGAAFAQDPTGQQGALLPIRVHTCELEGLLKQIVYIDLVGLDAGAARSALRAGVRQSRALPSVEPLFPGDVPSPLPPVPSFPGEWPEIWQVPYPRNPFFTGRENLLSRLSTQLRTGHLTAVAQPQAISGLGGIGKTQTCIEYAYRYRNEYQAALWVKADTYEALLSDFVAIARLINLPEKDAEDHQKLAAAAVKRWLEMSKEWLLIVDNADNLDMVKPFLPSVDSGHVLLTTRTQATGTIAQSIEIEKMDTAEGALFLLRRVKLLAPDAPLENASKTDCDGAREIATMMDGLPLALDQAGPI